MMYIEGRDESMLAESADFVRFYCRTRPSVLDSARRMCGHDHHLAEEVTQQAFFEIYRSWAVRQFRPDEYNRRYVVRIMANKLADHYRDTRRLAPWENDSAPSWIDPEPNEPMPEYRLLRQLIDEQPPRRRAVVVLYFLEDFDYQEIARTLRMEASTVRTHVQRARAALLPYAEQLRQAMKEGRA